LLFFFSSRRRHTRCLSDWSSDVCSSDLYNVATRYDRELVDRCAREGIAYTPFFPLGGFTPLQSAALDAVAARLGASPRQVALARSEERRVGKEWRSRWSVYHGKVEEQLS